MFCPNCGHQNPDNVPACQRCAAPLTATPNASAPKPAPKFKGTMLMTSSSPEAPRGAGGVPAQFQKTMVGGMAAIDPSTLGGDGGDEDLDLESKTVMQPSQFSDDRGPASGMAPNFAAPPRAPQPPLAQPPLAQPPAPQAPVAPQPPPSFAQPPAPQPPFAQPPAPQPQPPFAPPRAPTPQPQSAAHAQPEIETGASTMAVDASAFGLGGSMPAPPPNTFQPPRPQQPAPPAAPPMAAHEEPVSGVASTLAVDISAFGLGGPGQPGGPGGPSPFGPGPGMAPQHNQAPQHAPQNQGAQQPPPGASGGVSSTVAVDISAFGLGGPGQPGGPGGPSPYGPGPQGPQGYPQQGHPQGQFNPMQPGPQGYPQQGHPQGQFNPMQPGPQGYPQGPQGQFNPMQPQGFPQPPATAAPAGNKNVMLIVVGIAVFLLAASVVAAIVLRTRGGTP